MPPIIYLNCHDAGRLIQPHGIAVATPNLQAFAEDSLFFHQAHCVAPTCSPSRAALLTGRYPHQVGMLGLAHRGFQMNDYSGHLARRLKALGYRTALCGHQHVAPEGRETEWLGYTDHLALSQDECLRTDLGERDKLSAIRAAKFLEAHDKSSPFYLECGFFYPHRPYPAGATRQSPGAAAPPPYLPNNRMTREDMRGYQIAIENTDACFGIVLEALRQTGWYDRAIIVVTTDHGPAFPWAKCHLNDRGTGVMLMVRLPGQTQPVESDSMVTHLDVLPTIAEILGWPNEPWEGTSLLPVLTHQDARLHDAIFSEVTYHAAYEPMRSIRTDRFRYVQRFDQEWRHPVLPNLDDGPSKSLLLNAGLKEWLPETEALHDLTLDPLEKRNLIGRAEWESISADLQNRLRDWMERTADPLLQSPVPSPPGAVTSLRSDLSYDQSQCLAG